MLSKKLLTILLYMGLLMQKSDSLDTVQMTLELLKEYPDPQVSNINFKYFIIIIIIVYKFLERNKDGIERKKKGGRDAVLNNTMDKKLLDMITTFREQGAAVYIATVQTSVRALLCHYQMMNVLEKFKASDSWARKWLTRNKFSYRVATKGKLKKLNIEQV